MNGPLVLTDKETILVLRARVAELEAEVKAWEAFDRESACTRGQAEQIAILRPLLRSSDRQAGGLCAYVLMFLIDHAGRPVSPDRLHACCRAIGNRGASEDGRVLDVRICRLRSALKGLGFPGVIQFQRGSGWMITRDDAKRITSALLGERNTMRDRISDC